MKTAYKWFDIFLNLLLVVVVLAGGVIFVLGYNGYNFPPNSFAAKGVVVTVILLISLIFGVLYTIIGVSLWIVNRKKSPERASFGKRMFWKGIIRSVLSFVLFFILSLALSFFSLSLGNCLCLPKLPEGSYQESSDQNPPAFPVSDLVITDRKSYPPEISGDNWSCDLTVENKNASLSAVNITFDTAYLNRTSDDSIPAGGTKVINVYADNSSPTACNNISITAADILDTGPSPSISPSPSK